MLDAVGNLAARAAVAQTGMMPAAPSRAVVAANPALGGRLTAGSVHASHEAAHLDFGRKGRNGRNGRNGA